MIHSSNTFPTSVYYHLSVPWFVRVCFIHTRPPNRCLIIFSKISLDVVAHVETSLRQVYIVHSCTNVFNPCPYLLYSKLVCHMSDSLWSAYCVSVRLETIGTCAYRLARLYMKKIGSENAVSLFNLIGDASKFCMSLGRLISKLPILEFTYTCRGGLLLGWHEHRKVSRYRPG